jgi:lysophospholipase L1-like esterase
MPRRVLREFGAAVFVTLFFFVVAEAALRVIYFIRQSMVTHVPLIHTFGGNVGPNPPWNDNFRLIVSDDTLVWRMRPNMRLRYVDVYAPVNTTEELASLRHRFWPTLPAALRANRVWQLSTNSEGFRDGEFPGTKPRAVFRVVCLGDSWTVGQGANQDETYPRRLKTLLAREFPRGHFEVLNLGILGFTVFGGQKLMQRVLQLEPDIVVFAFAMNEPKMAGFTDADLQAQTAADRAVARTVARTAQKSEVYRLLRYWALRLKWNPKSAGEQVKGAQQALAWRDEILDPARRKPWMITSLKDYEQTHLDMIATVRRHGADAVLLYNEFWTNGAYLRVLQKIARQERVPLVDGSALLDEVRQRIEDELEQRLDLRPAASSRSTVLRDPVNVVFRVFLGDRPVPRAIYIVGNHPALGDLVPNKVAMYDDGTHGDQRAGDNVWSYTARVPRGTRLSYIYTNSGTEGQWDGLDLQRVRDFTVDGETTTIYAPIESFGRIYMRADNWHPDSSGYNLIAGGVLGALRDNGHLKRYLDALPESAAAKVPSDRQRPQ